jgi:hypothetical protein
VSKKNRKSNWRSQQAKASGVDDYTLVWARCTGTDVKLIYPIDAIGQYVRDELKTNPAVQADTEKSEVLLVYHLCRSGRAVFYMHMSSPKLSPEELKAFERHAEPAVLALYDELYPENAAKAQEYVSHTVDMVQQMQSSVEEQFSPDQFGAADFTLDRAMGFLKHLEEQFLTGGGIDSFVGFMMPDGTIPFLPMPRMNPEDGKYRALRAVTEVAQMVGAVAIVPIYDGWLRDSKTNQRTGLEILHAAIVKPDGSVAASAAGRYKIVEGKYQVVTPLAILPDAEKGEQRMFPAWRVSTQVAPVGVVN